MSVTLHTPGHRALKTKPTAWCCVKALAVFVAGAVCWAAAVVVMLRATGS